jgi:hypothetical protein
MSSGAALLHAPAGSVLLVVHVGALGQAWARPAPTRCIRAALRSEPHALPQTKRLSQSACTTLPLLPGRGFQLLLHDTGGG